MGNLLSSNQDQLDSINNAISQLENNTKKGVKITSDYLDSLGNQVSNELSDDFEPVGKTINQALSYLNTKKIQLEKEIQDDDSDSSDKSSVSNLKKVKTNNSKKSSNKSSSKINVKSNNKSSTKINVKSNNKSSRSLNNIKGGGQDVNYLKYKKYKYKVKQLLNSM
jgi:hypothetical protein